MELPLVLKSAKRTCSFCPTQYEGETVDGRHVYVRFRWGYLAVYVGPTVDDAIRSDEPIFEWRDWDPLLGVMEHDAMGARTSPALVWPADVELGE